MGRQNESQSAFLKRCPRDGSRARGTSLLSAVLRRLLLECVDRFGDWPLRRRLGSAEASTKRWSRGLGGCFQIVPLSKCLGTVPSILSKNQSEESHLSGASGIHLSSRLLRYSGDIDLFHDSEEAVARNRKGFEKNGFHSNCNNRSRGLSGQWRDGIKPMHSDRLAARFSLALYANGGSRANRPRVAPRRLGNQ